MLCGLPSAAGSTASLGYHDGLGALGTKQCNPTRHTYWALTADGSTRLAGATPSD